MSELESVARPILTPMIHGSDRVLLDTARQAVVATWALKTAMMMQLADTSGASIPARDFAWVREHQTPPVGVQVLLAAYHPTTGSTRYDYQRIDSRHLATGVTTQDGYGIMLGVGSFLTYVFSPGFDPPRPHIRLPLQAKLADCWLEIAPATSTVTWPPRYGLSEEDADTSFEGFTGRGSVGPVGDRVFAARLALAKRRARPAKSRRGSRQK
jgi:hypothetical protein